MPVNETTVDATAVNALETLDPRTRRRQIRRAQILEAAWQIARRDGIGAVSLHEVARQVDLRQPSLYAYFSSKRDLYDAMFAEGFQALIDERRELEIPADPHAALIAGSRHFLEFCAREPARYQLLFQRPIPGFEPSEESMKISTEALGYLEHWLTAAGLRSRRASDLSRALLLGLAGEQIANEPGGTRWISLVDDAVEVLVRSIKSTKGRSRGRG